MPMETNVMSDPELDKRSKIKAAIGVVKAQEKILFAENDQQVGYYFV